MIGAGFCILFLFYVMFHVRMCEPFVLNFVDVLGCILRVICVAFWGLFVLTFVSGSFDFCECFALDFVSWVSI